MRLNEARTPPKMPNIMAISTHTTDILTNAHRLNAAWNTSLVNDAITNIEYHISKIREKQAK